MNTAEGIFNNINIHDQAKVSDFVSIVFKRYTLNRIVKNKIQQQQNK